MNDSTYLSVAKKEFSTAKAELDKVFQSLHDYSNERFLSKNVLIYRLIRSEIELLDVLYKISEFKSIRSQLSIQRIIINYYSILFLLTSFNSKEEQDLRCYLFLLDTFKSRKATQNNIKKETSDGRIIDLKQKGNELEQGDEKACQDVLQNINDEKLNLLVNEDVITYNNWKFKDPKKKGNKCNNRFSWTDLAKEAKIPKHFAIFYQDYASDFVHGIGSSLIIVEDEKNVDQIISETLKFSSILMLLTIKIIMNEFAEEIDSDEINSSVKERIDLIWN